MSVAKIGDWRRAAQLLRGAANGMERSIHTALRAEAQGLRTEIVSGLTDQAPGGSPIRPLAPTTLAARRLDGFEGDKALIRRADLRNAITVTVRGLSAFVGVPRKTVHGKSLVDIAKQNEFGFGPIVIAITEAMRRFLFALFRELGRAAGGGEGTGGGGGVVIIHIPARPFLRPAFEKWRRGARDRFLRRIGSDLFGVAAR
jgi:hypothetical protein